MTYGSDLQNGTSAIMVASICDYESMTLLNRTDGLFGLCRSVPFFSPPPPAAGGLKGRPSMTKSVVNMVRGPLSALALEMLSILSTIIYTHIVVSVRAFLYPPHT